MSRRGVNNCRWNKAWVRMRAQESQQLRSCVGAADVAAVVYVRSDGDVDEWRGQLPFPAAMRDRMQSFLDSRV